MGEDGEVRASSSEVSDYQLISWLSHADGAVSIMSYHGKYFSLDEASGILSANALKVGCWERFFLVEREPEIYYPAQTRAPQAYATTDASFFRDSILRPTAGKKEKAPSSAHSKRARKERAPPPVDQSVEPSPQPPPPPPPPPKRVSQPYGTTDTGLFREYIGRSPPHQKEKASPSAQKTPAREEKASPPAAQRVGMPQPQSPPKPCFPQQTSSPPPSFQKVEEVRPAPVEIKEKPPSAAKVQKEKPPQPFQKEKVPSPLLQPPTCEPVKKGKVPQRPPIQKQSAPQAPPSRTGNAPRSTPTQPKASTNSFQNVVTPGERLKEVLNRYPGFASSNVKLPRGWQAWSKADLELFVGSMGELHPGGRQKKETKKKVEIPDGEAPPPDKPPLPSTAALQYHRQVLGISPCQNDPSLLKKAYRQAALRWHPDKNVGDPHAMSRFHRIREAYEALSRVC